MALPELQVGSVVGHRYRIERSLGRGWIGSAFESVDLLDGVCRVALKVLQAEDRASERDGHLRRQFSILSGLRHPGLVRILDYGIHKDPAHAYLVEELVSGHDLLAWTEGVAGRQMIPLLTELCRALRYLHGQNIVHGDIKPANVLVVVEDQPLGGEAVGVAVGEGGRAAA